MRRFYLFTLIFWGVTLQVRNLQARQAALPFFENEAPEWYSPSSKLLELPDGQILITYQGGTKLFDGGKWNEVPSLRGLNILSAEIHKGEVWIGLDYDFGILYPVHRGEWEFRSMRHLLPDSSGIQNQIVGITSAGKYLFINTFYDTHIWDGKELKVLSAREVLTQAIGARAEAYPRVFLNMAFFVEDSYLLEVQPYGFVKFEEGMFVPDSIYTRGLPKTILFDLKKLSNGDLIAVSYAGLFKKRLGEQWEPFDTNIPQELLPAFFIQYQESGKGNVILQNERTAYFLNEQGHYLFNSNDIPGFSSNKGYLNIELTRDGIIWLPGDEGIVRIYPELPIHKQRTDVYTQSQFGSPFVWQGDEVIITDVYENFRLRKRKTASGIELDTLTVFPGGEGAILGVEQQGESLFFFYSNMIQEYRGDTLYAQSSLELPINRYAIPEGEEDLFLVSMRKGIGLLERTDENNWQQELIYANGNYARIAGISALGNRNYIGVTGNGEVFTITISDSVSEVAPLLSLSEQFGVSKIDAFVAVGNEFIAFSDKGAFSADQDHPERWTKGAGMVADIPEDVHLFGTLRQGTKMYFYGRGIGGASLWELDNGVITSVPIGGLDQILYMSIDPEGYIWLNSGSRTLWFDPEELSTWYDAQGTELTTWVEGSSLRQSHSAEGLFELPHNYESLILHTGFNNNFFPKKNRFRIRISDKAWGEWQADSQFDLSFLAPGNYTVEVQGINGLGQIHTSQATLIRIFPPWYLSNMAIICYLGMLILFGWWIIVRIVSYRSHRMELSFKAKQVDELRKMDRMKSRLLMNISHELKTPLTLTLAPLEQLKDELLSGEGKWEQPYNLAVRNGKRLKELVNQVIDLARLDSENLTPNFETLNMTAFLGVVVNSFESLAAKRNIVLEFTSDQEGIMAAVDRDKMQKVISNLLSNAIKFTPSRGEITVTLSGSTAFFTVTVSDTGSGIEPERLPFIFDRFYTNAERTPGNGDGIGVGLSICREFVTLHGGEIEAESEVDKGTTFNVRIPYNLDKAKNKLTKLPAEELVRGIGSEFQDSYPTPVQPLLNSGTEILLIEDNEDLRSYIASVLSRQGYQVVEKKHGKDALRYLVTHMPDLIITDLMMPGMNGLEFMEKIRENTESRRIPVIMLTALSGNNEKIQALELGVSDYLLKPFSEKELLVRIKNLIKFKHERDEIAKNDETATEIVSDQHFTRKLRQFVVENLDKPRLKADDLSNAVNMSRRQFFRAIKAETGCTPVEFIKEVRMYEARNILQTQKNRTISEVSHAVGIATPSYFVKVYKDHFGVHPKEHKI